MKDRIKKNIFRLTIAVISIIFILIGFFAEELISILNNATFICLSCIGIG